jgi:hypothetical protein
MFMTEMQNLIGQTLGKYKVMEQIGQGGMATVFKAYQAGLNRDIALKVLLPYIAQKEGFAERFIREAQAIGNLHHPNILPVHDSGQDKGYGYIAMRYVPGATTLARRMKERLTTEQIIDFISQIASALDSAHQAGVIHRDVKPSNILMDGDWLLLSDFGLAKMVELPSELTGSGVGLGTPAYMSPEQAKGEKLDHRTDIYALGIILFEMLTGRVPHQAETPLATVIKRINEPLPLPRQFKPDINQDVEKVVLKALARDPEERFASGGDLAAALRVAFAGASDEQGVIASDHTSLIVPVPADAASKESGKPARLDKAVPASIQKSAAEGRHPMEYVVLTVLGLIALLGLGGAVVALTLPDQTTGQINYELFPACMGMLLAGATSMGLIWARKRQVPASAWLAAGIALWFLGLNILGWGGFAVLSPDERSFTENLGFSIALCFAPGGIMTLLGLAFYSHDYRRGLKATVRIDEQTGVSTGKKDGRIDKIQRAIEYRTAIFDLIEQHKETAFADQLAPIKTKLDRWAAHLRELTEKLTAFESNRIIQRDLRDVPTAIQRLQTQLEVESDPQVRSEIDETLDRYREHQLQLDALVNLMRRTELDIDETVAAIGTIYSQMQLLDIKKIDHHRAKRLSADIEEQADNLNDLLLAMDEVYDDSASFS